jgi:predicted nucleotidyltransferase
MAINRGLKRRSLPGAPWADNLVRWLNNAQEKRLGRNTRASRKRIIDLIGTLKDTWDAIKAASPDIDLMGFHPRKLTRLLSKLNKQLAEYQTSPFVYTECDRTIFVDYEIAGHRCAGESLAAYAVIELEKLHLLDRLGKCICGKCFFASFRHQRFCTAACRHKNYERTEGFKNRRREYMRNYYRLKKSGKVK